MSRRAVLVALLATSLARTAFAVEWHVDPLGDDAAAGDAAAPWRTIQHAIRQALPGDTVRVHAGTYVEAVDIERSGSPEAPIALRGVGGATLVAPPGGGSLEAIDVAAGVGHLVIEDLAVEGFAESILLRQGAHDVVLRGCAARGGAVGIWIAGATGIVVEGCALDGNRLGLRVSGAASDVVVRDTTSAGSDDGLGCDGDADGFSVEETASAVRFERCVARANGEDGFDLQGERVTVAESESRGNGCAGLKLGQDARVENTLVTGNRTGIATSSFFGAPVRIELVNNTVADNRGVQLLLRGRAADPARPSTVLLRNLIVAGAGKLLEVETPLQLLEDHNLFFRPDTGDGAIVVHRDDGEQRYSGQAINEGRWAAESGQGTGTLAIEPRFVDPERYAVAADSAAIDRGAAAEAPAVDRAGQSRPAGPAPDIGVDEAALASDNHAPWADPGPDRDLAPGARQRLLAVGSVDPDGDALTYQWDFGDGSPPESGASVEHAWEAIGEYRLALTVSDGVLSHTRAATVRVREAPPSPSPTPTDRPTEVPIATASETPTVPPSAAPTDSPTDTPTDVPTGTPTGTPSTTATPTASETPTTAPPAHDSTLDVAREVLRVRLTDRRPDGSRRLRMTVGNADVLPLPERPGHLVRVVVEASDCPPALRIGSPTFTPERRGIGDATAIDGGRRRRVAVRVSVDPDALPPGTAPALRCTLVVRAVGPAEDPTPGDNAAAVAVEIDDRRRR
jgi:hypothetical protein